MVGKIWKIREDGVGWEGREGREGWEG